MKREKLLIFTAVLAVVFGGCAISDKKADSRKQQEEQEAEAIKARKNLLEKWMESETENEESSSTEITSDAKEESSSTEITSDAKEELTSTEITSDEEVSDTQSTEASTEETSEYTFHENRLFGDYKSGNEKLLDMFMNNEIECYPSYDSTEGSFLFSDIPTDPNEPLDYYYVEGRADIDNDGENELLLGGTYGGKFIDASNDKVFVMTEGEGTAGELDYCFYEGKAYVLHEDVSHGGRLVYIFSEYDSTGKELDSFSLEAWSESSEYDSDETAEYSFKEQTINCDEFNRIRNEIEKKDRTYIGAYDSADYNDLEIGRNGDKFIVQIGIYRLTSLSNGGGELTDKGIDFTATDAAGNPISGTITFEGDQATVTFTDSTWDYLPNGTNFTFDKQSYIPAFFVGEDMFR